MKKLVKFLLPILALNFSLISGCNSTPENKKILLSFGDMNNAGINEVGKDEKITLSDLVDKISNQEENLMLAISSNTCMCWYDFKPIVEKYSSDNNLICYHVTYNDFIEVASNFQIGLVKSDTTFVIFENGAAKIQITSSVHKNVMNNYSDFKAFMDSTIELPKCYFIEEQDFDNLIDTKKNAVIYFERSACKDCSYLNPNFIKKYALNHKDMKPLYVLDCQDYYGTEEYQLMKDKFGLSNVNNPNFGYNDGCFPYLSYISNGEFTSGAVAFNETVELKNEKFYITDTYYTQERAANLLYFSNFSPLKDYEIPRSEIEDHVSYYKWNKDYSIKKYAPILEAFLDYSLPFTNFVI